MGRFRFPGLRSFEETEAALFNGRTEEKQALFDMIMVEQSVVLFAKSGAGKSSLIRAGIIPMLANLPYQPVYIRLNEEKKSPVWQAGRQIAQVFGIPFPEEFTLWEYLQKINNSTGNTTPILFFDQFEEFFTFHGKTADGQVFIEQLADVLNQNLPHSVHRRLVEAPAGADPEDNWINAEKPPRVKMVFSIRSDRLSELHELSVKIPGILRNRFELRGLKSEQAIQAIVRPAAITGADYMCPPFQIAPDALQEIVNSLVSGQADTKAENPEIESFQLQLVCRDLEEKMLAQHQKGVQPLVVTRETFGGQAGIERLLSRFYMDSLESIADNKQRHNAQITIEEELIKNGSRVIQPAASLREGEHGVSDDTLRSLVEMRLLRREVRPDSGHYYELAHDTLLAPILTFRTERKIRESAELRGKKFLKIAGIVAGFGILGAAATFFVQEYRANTNLIIAQSAIQAQQDATRAFSLAEIAYEREQRNLEAVGSMIHAYYGDLFQRGDSLYATPYYRDFDALWVKPIAGSNKILIQTPNTRVLQVIEPSSHNVDSIVLDEHILDAAVEPKGRWLVAIDSAGTARLYTFTEGERGRATVLPEKALFVDIAPNGKWFTTTNGGSQSLWTDKGALVQVFGHTTSADQLNSQASYSPDSRHLFVRENDSVAVLYALQTGAERLEKITALKTRWEINDAAFSPNGRYLGVISTNYPEGVWAYLFDIEKRFGGK